MASIEHQYDEAIELQEAGELEGAVGKLQSLLDQAPEFALAYAALSVFYSRLGRHQEAVDHAQKVCDLEPDDPFSFVAMSLICQKAGRLAEAEQALGAAMEKQWAAMRKPDG